MGQQLPQLLLSENLSKMIFKLKKYRCEGIVDILATLVYIDIDYSSK